MRSTVYSDIVSMFCMNDRPQVPFHPNHVVFKKLVLYALEKSFNDFNFRTLTKTNAFKEEYTAWETQENAIRKAQKQNKQPQKPEPKMTAYLIDRLDTCGFLDRFVDYFKAAAPDQSQFDHWHNKTCEQFLEILDGAKAYTNYTKAYTGLAYGKAQKIVNMMFKHLYCIDGADRYDDYFKHCHMVLDNFTLEWFKRTLGEKRIDSWSNLIYKDPSVDHNDYMFYQAKIRQYFLPTNSQKHTYAGLTPFQAEFYIWPEIQWQMATADLINQNLLADVMRSGTKIVKDPDIVAKCDSLLQQLTALQHMYR